MTHAWKPLKIGDKIAVVNACMIDSQKEFHANAYKELFESWGYGINGAEELQNQVGNRLWSGVLEERATRVIEAIMNPENKAICLLVGGDGANEVMKLVAEYHAQELSKGDAGHPLPKRGIPVIGLSNNTTLLNPLAQLGIISPIQGKLDAAIPSPTSSDEEKRIISGNAQALRSLLAGEASELSFLVTSLNVAAQKYRGEDAKVEIVGGCNFHVIESARTPFQSHRYGETVAILNP